MKQGWLILWVIGMMGGWAMADTEKSRKDVETATFGGGCFWCVEAVFEGVEGVLSVVSGYEGGDQPQPTYEQVSSGRSGHAEVVRIEFDPHQVSYDRLLDLFWEAHDPTQVNRQGADVGTQYRSVIFYMTEDQRLQAEAAKAKLGASGKYDKPIATQIVPSTGFYPAEPYHQDYFRNHPRAPYSMFVIQPKLKKLGRK